MHNEYMQENPRNSTGQTEDHVPWICLPQGDLPTVHSRYKHTEAMHCQGVLLGVFHPCLWPLKAPGTTLGEGRQASRQLSDASTHPQEQDKHNKTMKQHIKPKES